MTSYKKHSLRTFIVIAAIIATLYFSTDMHFHTFNKNYREVARRNTCRNNLLQFQKLIDSAGGFDASNLKEAKKIIDEVGQNCPSGEIVNPKDAGYFVQIRKGKLVITESARNHDTSQMSWVSLPTLIHELSDGKINEVIVISE